MDYVKPESAAAPVAEAADDAPEARLRKSRSADLCVVIPVFEEGPNIRPMVEELRASLEGVEWEVLFVDDDSGDGTIAEIAALAAQDRRVRCLRRIGRRGLSSATIEGMLGSLAPLVAVMDGDLQHDPQTLRAMLDIFERESSVELIVGSRYVQGGSLGEWEAGRVFVSRLATRLGKVMVPKGLKDPMSGFFMLRRSLLDDVVHKLSALGFKILLDILASSSRSISFREVAIAFRNRRHGASKLDSLIAWEYLMLLADKMIGRYVPVRFISFVAIGALGLLVHLAVLAATFSTGLTRFAIGQTLATSLAMIFNYSLNNLLTYRDQRRRGVRWLSGLASFALVCSVGAIANVRIATYLFEQNMQWAIAALCGALTGAVWNYAVTSLYTWGRRR